MTRVAILPETTSGGDRSYRAIAGDKQSVGRTAGEALDALVTQLADDAAGTLAIVQRQQPDRFFTAEQRRRLEELMARWREARDCGQGLPASEQAELDQLVEAELHGSAQRTAALLRELAP